MELLLNHKRFKKILSWENLSNYLPNKKRIFDFPHTSYKYFNFFNFYVKENYEVVSTICICKNQNDTLVSLVDRYGVEFHLVICEECGLVRAKHMLSSKDLVHFYEHYYRHVHDDDEDDFKSPEELYNTQYSSGKIKCDIIRKFYSKEISPETKIVDVGGAVGGILENFKPSNNLYLADFFEPYKIYAEKKDINIIHGGLEKIEFKPDIIILSHVVEHWDNFEEEIKKLIKIQKTNETLNYIEFPAIDSLKFGRRAGDFLGDIHYPHTFYFSCKVFMNIMNRYGFKKIFSDTHSRSIYIFTGEEKPLINFSEDVKKDLLLAEKRRNYEGFKKITTRYIPNSIKNILKSLIAKT